MTPRSWAVVALVALAFALAVTATALVPWRVPRPTRASGAAALRDLPVDMITRGRELHAALRPSSYGSLLSGLVAPVLLGFTPAGAGIVAWVAQPFGAHRLAEGVLGGFYTLTQLVPVWWWAFGAVSAGALVVLLSFVFPVLVEPVFNRFTPMQAGPLRDELLVMAARDGIPVRDVLVADASRGTSGLNAYVSGFGPTRRIVVYDTLLREAPAREVRGVVAHELGHAKDRDAELGTLLGAIGAAAAVVALYLLGHWDGLLRRAGVDSIGSPRAIGLVLALLALAGLVTGPLQSLVSRRVEARADQHALRLTRDAGAFAAMQVRLAAVNIADVHPPRLEYLLFATHPDTVERLAAAREAGGRR